MAAAAHSSQTRRVADMLFEDSQFETAAIAEASAVKLVVKKARHEHKSMEDIKELISRQTTSISEVMKITMVATQALSRLAAIMMHTACLNT